MKNTTSAAVTNRVVKTAEGKEAKSECIVVKKPVSIIQAFPPITRIMKTMRSSKVNAP
jgi:hypothetical protein